MSPEPAQKPVEKRHNAVFSFIKTREEDEDSKE